MSDQLKASIVRIIRKDSGVTVGAGFLISDKHILTCAHVVAQALGLQYDTPDMPVDFIHLDFPLCSQGEIFTSHVVSWLPVQPDTSTQLENAEDIAVLELTSIPPETARPTRLVVADDLWGHSFRAFGFPAGYDKGVWTSGVLRDRQAAGWVQIEDVKVPGYSVIEGFSGTAVWDEQLNSIVGMVVESDKQAGPKAAFFIPARQLIRAWPPLSLHAIPSCPYRGLFAFREQDAPFFFGREKFTELLLSSMQNRSFVALIGASGSGKSSLVFAGLIPYLRSQGDWHIISLRPGENPFYSMASSLLPLLEPTLSEVDRLCETNKLAERLQQKEIELSHIVERIIQKYTGTHLLLAIDQFEELYTLCQGAEKRQSFLDLLLTAIKSTSSSLISHAKLVVTLRADFLGFLLSHRPFADVLQENILAIGAMTRQEQQEIIEKPAHKLNVKVEDGLAERILAEVEREPGSLPLLEFALTQLWAKQKDGRLTHVAYKEVGGVEQALAVYAEEIYKQFSHEEQQQAQQVFVQLVHPGEGTEDIRRVATRAELGEERWAIVMRLADARLVVSGRDEMTGKETVEVVHEALIRGWKRLRIWIDTDREFRIWQERLRTMLHEWEIHSRDNDTLLRGASLIEAESWIVQHPEAISETERAFIQKSLEQRQLRDATEHTRQASLLSLQRRAVRRQRFVIGMMGVTSIVLVIGLIIGAVLYNSLQGENNALRRSIPATVINLNDNGPGSLRQAIANASQGSTITFADGLRGTILLTSGELVIVKNLIISGPGPSVLRISGGNKNRVFLVDRNVFVTISGLTIENGVANDISNGGGGIFLSSSTLLLINSIISNNIAPNQSINGQKFYGYGGGIENQFGTLSLSNSGVLDNTATGYGGGIDNSGSLILNNSTVSGNTASFDGGAIFNDGTLDARTSTISDNTATSGGGINNFLGGLTLDDSSVFNNRAKDSGGGIEHDGPDNLTIQNSTISGNTATYGGGIDNTAGGLTLNNSTISDNVAQSRGGGIAISGRQADITFCTIYGNRAMIGGGISLEIPSVSGVSMTTSIVAGNSAKNGPDVNGLLTLSYPNLIENTSGATLTLARISYDPAATEFAKHSIFGKSPNLGPLQNNGGPTQTRALLPNSPAIDQVPLKECSSNLDQRGMKRPDGEENVCDIGAYEYMD